MSTFLEQLQELTGNPVKRLRLDPLEFQEFKAVYRDNRDGIDDQKLLEYFISYKFLDFNASDVYMDIAAQDCPFAFFIREKFSCRIYRQDLYYLKRGVHGDDIGGNASRLPLPDESVGKMSLHNSFEHFEGNSDIRFIREAQRILRIGGRMIIVPIAFEGTYRVDKRSGWLDERGKKRLWGRGARFSRFYDIPQFNRRIVENAPAFDIQFFSVENIREVGRNCYGNNFIVFEKTRPFQAQFRLWKALGGR